MKIGILFSMLLLFNFNNVAFSQSLEFKGSFSRNNDTKVYEALVDNGDYLFALNEGAFESDLIVFDISDKENPIEIITFYIHNLVSY